MAKIAEVAERTPDERSGFPAGKAVGPEGLAAAPIDGEADQPEIRSMVAPQLESFSSSRSKPRSRW